MPTLYIDLGSAHPVFALADDTRTLGVRALVDQKDEEALMPTLESLLKDCGSAWADIDRIALMAGPGGFMSIRVGAALANALAFGLDVPTAGIHGSAVWGARVRDIDPTPRAGTPAADQNTMIEQQRPSGARRSDHDQDFLWLHSTKKDQVFIRGFGAYAAHWPESVLVSLETALTLTLSHGEREDCPAPVGYVGELISEHQQALSHMKRIDQLKPLAEALPELVADLDYRKDRTLVPWYGREA